MDVNEDPTSTWGATTGYKEAWEARYGRKSPAGNASKAEWMAWAVENGASEEDAEASTVSDLKAAYGDGGTGLTPQVHNTAEGDGKGTTYGSPDTGAAEQTSAGTPKDASTGGKA